MQQFLCTPYCLNKNESPNGWYLVVLTNLFKTSSAKSWFFFFFFFKDMMILCFQKSEIVLVRNFLIWKRHGFENLWDASVRSPCPQNYLGCPHVNGCFPTESRWSLFFLFISFFFLAFGQLLVYGQPNFPRYSANLLDKTLKLTWSIGSLAQKKRFLLLVTSSVAPCWSLGDMSKYLEPDASSTLSFDRRHF